MPAACLQACRASAEGKNCRNGKDALSRKNSTKSTKCRLMRLQRGEIQCRHWSDASSKRWNAKSSCAAHHDLSLLPPPPPFPPPSPPLSPLPPPRGCSLVCGCTDVEWAKDSADVMSGLHILVGGELWLNLERISGVVWGCPLHGTWHHASFPCLPCPTTLCIFVAEETNGHHCAGSTRHRPALKAKPRFRGC